MELEIQEARGKEECILREIKKKKRAIADEQDKA